MELRVSLGIDLTLCQVLRQQGRWRAEVQAIEQVQGTDGLRP